MRVSYSSLMLEIYRIAALTFKSNFQRVPPYCQRWHGAQCQRQRDLNTRKPVKPLYMPPRCRRCAANTKLNGWDYMDG